MRRPKALCQHYLEQPYCSYFANTLRRAAQGFIAAFECQIDASLKFSDLAVCHRMLVILNPCLGTSCSRTITYSCSEHLSASVCTHLPAFPPVARQEPLPTLPRSHTITLLCQS